MFLNIIFQTISLNKNIHSCSYPWHLILKSQKHTKRIHTKSGHSVNLIQQKRTLELDLYRILSIFSPVHIQKQIIGNLAKDWRLLFTTNRLLPFPWTSDNMAGIKKNPKGTNQCKLVIQKEHSGLDTRFLAYRQKTSGSDDHDGCLQCYNLTLPQNLVKDY